MEPSDALPSPFEPVAPGVSYFSVIRFANIYAVGDARAWALVDAGVDGQAPVIRRAVERHFGEGARPEAIILTHGHPDHVGSAEALAEGWDVPLYAHPLELPYLTGRSAYPPPDPTVGGPLAFIGRFATRPMTDLGTRLQPLPDDGRVPGMPGWQWIHTPGHAPGHVSLWRAADGVLLAGDAVATMDLSAWSSLLAKPRVLSRPPAAFTPDWHAARQSVQRLAELHPRIVVAGHGRPMTGPDVADDLERLGQTDFAPERGRYVATPAIADETGTTDVPPPAPDPLPKRWAAGALAAAGVLGAFLWHRRR